MRLINGVVMLVALSLLGVACSSSSDETTIAPTSTTGGSGASTTTSTSPAAATSSTTLPAGDLTVTIVRPAPLSTHVATVDLGNGRLAALVQLEAEVAVPTGESVEIAWASDIDGPLGGGATLEAELSNDRRDVVSHLITVTAASTGGSRGTATVEVIVRVESN